MEVQCTVVVLVFAVEQFVDLLFVVVLGHISFFLITRVPVTFGEKLLSRFVLKTLADVVFPLGF